MSNKGEEEAESKIAAYDHNIEPDLPPDYWQSVGNDDSNLENTPMDEEEVFNYDGNCCGDPTGYFQKAIAILLMCMLGFGSYFVYDMPGALIDQFEDTMNIDGAQFALMYSLYSWPNAILPVIGGVLVDKYIGLRKSAVLFSCFIVLGHYMTAMGAFFSSWPLMAASRLVFGIGGESLAVAQNTYASAWFRGEALNMVFGLQLSIARIGSSLTFIVSEPLYNQTIIDTGDDQHKSLGITLSVAGATCILSLLAAVFLGLIDLRKSRLTGQELEKQPEVRMRDVFLFPTSLWLVCIICVAFYVAIFPFVSFGKDFYMEIFHFDATKANYINGIPYFISAIGSPLFGFIIDRVGFNVMFVLIAEVLALVAHIMLGFTHLTPYVGVSFLGLGYSMLAGSLWPIIALILPLYRQGTAFGLVQGIQNLGLGLVAILVGWMKDKFGFKNVEFFYVACLGLSILATLALLLDSNRIHHGYLHMSAKKRKEFEKTEVYDAMMKKFGKVREEPTYIQGQDNSNYEEDNLVH